MTPTSGKLFGTADFAALAMILGFVALVANAPVANKGALSDVPKKMDPALEGPSGPKAGRKGVAAAAGELAAAGTSGGLATAPVTGMKAREPLSACGAPQGVGISTRLLPKSDAEKFADADVVGVVNAQGLAARNFLSPEAVIGHPSNTSSRIKSHDLRSVPVVEKTLTTSNTPFGVSPHQVQELQRPFTFGTLGKSDFDAYRKQLKK